MSYSCLKHGWTHVYEGCPLCVRTTQSSSSGTALSDHEGHLLGCLTCERSKVYNLSVAIAAEKERADKAEVERDNLLGKSSGKCVHEVDKFSIRGCYNCVLLQAEAAESALLAEKEKALKWERQCVVRGDQWEAAEERVRQLESERNSLVKSTGEHVTVREEYQSQIAALTEKLKVVGVRNKFLEQSISEHLEDCPIGSTEILGANP